MPSPISTITSSNPTSSPQPPASNIEVLPAKRKSRVSAEHTLSRVRENQRRHRARRRDHVASLERKLVEMTKELREVRGEIDVLRAEHALCPIRFSRSDNIAAYTPNSLSELAPSLQTTHQFSTPTPSTFLLDLTNAIPPPSPRECPHHDPSESTTLCAQAFVLISQQNFRNLDTETIRVWLAQGLRSAGREGEGCRVVNGVLWGLLEFIGGE